ncbi:hypothetical protein V1478_008578, partial [Vespula squamosa]
MTFDEYTSQLPQEAFPGNHNEARTQVQCDITHSFIILRNLFCFRFEFCVTTGMRVGASADGGVFRKRDLTHLQLAKKPETPEAEELESPLTRGSPDAATSTRWDLGRLIIGCRSVTEIARSMSKK